MDLTNEQKRAMLDEIIALSTVPPIAKDEVTAADYVERTGDPLATVQGRLKRMVQQGVLTKRIVLGPNGRRVAAYRIVDETED